MIRVAVDALGGDRVPEEIVAGAVEAASPEIEPVLFGPSGFDTRGLPLVEASDSIEMDEHPVEAVRAKPESSGRRRRGGHGRFRGEHGRDARRLAAPHPSPARRP
jgi:fatty acid/phospholipid biosynthesis enzyme